MQKSHKNKCKKLDKRTVFVVLYELIFIFLVNALKESAKPSGTYRESAVAESRRAEVFDSRSRAGFPKAESFLPLRFLG